MTRSIYCSIYSKLSQRGQVALAWSVVTAGVKTISLQEAHDRKMFGPVWHGTTETARQAIHEHGFKVELDAPRNSYIDSPYFGGVPAPIHHLGYGVYFTTSKSNARMYAGGTTRGMKTYYLDAPRLETINWGAPRTMMKWWQQNGYDPKLAKQDRVAATKALTEQLSSQYDAVWYKGKGLRRLLDGDQVVVFDPDRIYQIDPKLAKGIEAGARVRRKSDGMLGTVTEVRMDETAVHQAREQWSPTAHPWLAPSTTRVVVVRWRRGGTEYNVQDVDLEPAP